MAEVPDDAERRLPSPPSTLGSEASEETPMHAAWWAEERPDLFLPVPPALASYHDTTRPMQLAWDGCCRGWEVFFDEAEMGRWSL